MPRFLLTEGPDESGCVRITGRDARHLAGPLRTRPGERLSAALSGRLLDLEVLSVSRHEVVARVLGESTVDEGPCLRVTLLLGMCKGPRLETAIEKCTELGVACIAPLLLERSVARVPEERSEHRLARWQRIAEEARKQCGRTEAPEILRPMTLDEALADDWERLVILDPLATAALEAGGGDARSVAVLIGPEGGLTEEEEARAESAGGVRRSLGQHVLRTETAAIAACAVLLLPGAASTPEALATS